MKRSLRLLSVVAALAAAALSLSACDVSPYAVKVNGQVITVNQLNSQLAAFTSNKAFVTVFNQNEETQAQQSGSQPATVAGDGVQGTYSSQFVAQVLNLNVQAVALRQHLTAIDRLPTPDETTAARAAQQATGSGFWSQFPPSVRTLLVDQLAYEAALTPVPTDTSSLQGPYSEIKPYLFSRICVVTASAFTRAAAQSIAASKRLTGAQVCYSQEELESQSAALQSAVRNLQSVGQVSPIIPTAYGFQVLELASRTSPGFSAGVKRVLQADTNPPSSIGEIVKAAHVSLNPAYGTWANGQVSPPGNLGSS